MVRRRTPRVPEPAILIVAVYAGDRDAMLIKR
jgi:hypothetical protein